MQAKLDELIRTSKANNRFIGIEHLTEIEVGKIPKTCERAVNRPGGRRKMGEQRPGD